MPPQGTMMGPQGPMQGGMMGPPPRTHNNMANNYGMGNMQGPPGGMHGPPGNMQGPPGNMQGPPYMQHQVSPSELVQDQLQQHGFMWTNSVLVHRVRTRGQ